MQTNIRFDLQPKQRQKLAEEIATALRAIPSYQKVPSMVFKIGGCTLEKDDTVSFACFQFITNPDEVSAYTKFVSRLCDLTRKLKWFSSCPKESDDDKYAFRCFLLRFDFIGDKYKKARKVLLKNLTGNSAFRYDK